jgi:hypothetical protein
MRFCATCGRPRAGGSKTCSGCGSPFPDAGPASPPDIPGFGRGSAPARAPSRITSRPVALAVIAIALAAGGAGTAVWLSGSHGPAYPDGTAAASSSQARLKSPTAASPGLTSQPAAANSGHGAVTVTAAAVQDPDASAVAAFLDRYFTAINSHDYQAYASLLSPPLQQDLTPASFNSGYRGTADSAETLVRISAAADGDTAAAVTFTSHQDPDVANREEACTSWRISLFLAQDGSGYLIDQAPQGYHAAPAPCS